MFPHQSQWMQFLSDGASIALMKVLQIGNYPPPACGWAIQTKLLVEEIRRRGHVCEVLNINESRKIKSDEYVDVQNGFDYIYKISRFAGQGYLFQINVNGQSRTGYVLAALAAMAGRIAGRPALLSWRGGLQQKYFPREEKFWLRWAYRQLFRLAGRISCDSEPVKKAIEGYGIEADRVIAIPAFSVQNLNFEQAELSHESEAFLNSHDPVFFCYVSFRPEYNLEMLREAMGSFRQAHPTAGFVWLGFPSKEMPAVTQFVSQWAPSEREGLLLLGNLDHAQFLTLLSRCFAYVRTPACDGVAASILESLSLGIPVIASENGTRPEGVTTFLDNDASDLRAKLEFALDHYEQIRQGTRLKVAEDNVEKTVDWVLNQSPVPAPQLQVGAADGR